MNLLPFLLILCKTAAKLPPRCTLAATLSQLLHSNAHRADLFAAVHEINATTDHREISDAQQGLVGESAKSAVMEEWIGNFQTSRDT